MARVDVPPITIAKTLAMRVAEHPRFVDDFSAPLIVHTLSVKMLC